MHLMTKYFGQIDYDPTEVLSFPNGILGFEEEKQFLLLPFHGGGGNLLCFQSVGTPSLAFVAMNPFSLDPNYAPVLSDEESLPYGALLMPDPVLLCPVCSSGSL